MSGRPESLWPLFADITGLEGIGPKTAQALAGAGIETPRDLLYTLPYSGVDRSLRDSVLDADLPGVVTVEAMIGSHRAAARRGGAYRVEADDARTRFQIVFFRGGGDYISRVLPTGQKRILSGRVELFEVCDVAGNLAQVGRFDRAGAQADGVEVFGELYPANLEQPGSNAGCCISGWQPSVTRSSGAAPASTIRRIASVTPARYAKTSRTVGRLIRPRDARS